MEMHELFRPFLANGVVRGSILMLSAQEARKLVEVLRRNDVKILGIDAFRLTEGATIPLMEHSIDMSWTPSCFDVADGFLLARKDLDLHFEIVV